MQPPQSKYEGQFVDGRFDGFGVFTKNDGTKYEGAFKEGRVEGAGKVTFPDGTNGKPRQEGSFADRKLAVGGKQAGAISSAQQAQQMAQAKAKSANDLKE